MTELTEAIQLFVEGKTVSTKQTYLSESRNLEAYLTEKRLSLKSMQPIHAKEFIYRQKAMNSKASYKKFLSAFLRFIGRKDLVKYIRDNMREVKVEEKFAVDLVLEEILKLINVTKTVHYQFAWSVMAFEGLRPGEVLGLYFEDVDAKRKKVTLKRREGERYGPKGMKSSDKPEQLDLNSLSLALFKRISQGEGRILPVSYKTLRKWFNHYAQQAGVTGKEYPVTMHKLRHFFGHYWNRRKGNIRILKEVMRHSRIEYTLLYTKPSEEEIKDEFVTVVEGGLKHLL